MSLWMLSVFNPAAGGEFGPFVSREEMQQAMAATGAFNARLQADGVLVFVDGLFPADQGTTVALVDGEPQEVASPWGGAPPVLGGFWVVDVASRDEAVALVREAARACRGTIEARPFQPHE